VVSKTLHVVPFTFLYVFNVFFLKIQKGDFYVFAWLHTFFSSDNASDSSTRPTSGHIWRSAFKPSWSPRTFC